MTKDKLYEKMNETPLDQLLREAYKKRGSIRGMADELEVSPSTIQYWLKKANLKVGRGLVEIEVHHAS